MKKILFNDRYGLTQAVLEGRKTMTRRIIPLTDTDREYLETAFDFDMRAFVIIDDYSRYRVGEEVAVAQCYEDAILDVGEEEWNNRHKWYCIENLRAHEGFHKKMFVRADLMPHSIRITNIKVERLQDISEEDAMREGVFKYEKPPLHHEMDLYAPWPPYVKPYVHDGDNLKYRRNARYAFAYLIDKISGTGTWNRNPWVFAYEFELVR